ncbi:MAG: Fur family transcriptional regulator [Campylobacterota bacterium]|nr:Fur family transcriptional regulator [Campylobacterota bacterium]
MCKVPTNKIKEYLEFLKIVEKRLESHNQNLTINKSIILELLFENSEHLCAEDIIKLSKKKENNSLKASTVYRALNTFETFGIVDSITVGDKKRYELSYFKQPHYHLYCQECNTISEFESLDIHDMFLRELKHLKFKPTNFNIIINGVCSKCQK